MDFYEEQYTAEQSKIAETIIQMEKDALAKFYKGDTSDYQNLWSKDSFTYFDGNTFQRIDNYEDIYDFLMTRVEGKLSAKSWNFVSPRVQFGIDMAVLTYQLHAETNYGESHYNVIEVYQINKSNDWEVIHSTWAAIRPFAKKTVEGEDDIII